LKDVYSLEKLLFNVSILLGVNYKCEAIKLDTVDDVVISTGYNEEVIELFIETLQEYGISSKYQFDGMFIQVLKEAVNEASEPASTGTLKYAMHKAIQTHYVDQIEFPFEWTQSSKITYLNRLIQTNSLKYEWLDLFPLSKNNNNSEKTEDHFIVYDLLLNNFANLGNTKFGVYRGSNSVDGEPNNNHKFVGADHFYLVIGKLNSITREDDLHVFYNEGAEFNMMRCQYIGGGSQLRGITKELQELCDSCFKEYRSQNK